MTLNPLQNKNKSSESENQRDRNGGEDKKKGGHTDRLRQSGGGSQCSMRTGLHLLATQNSKWLRLVTKWARTKRHLTSLQVKTKFNVHRRYISVQTNGGWNEKTSCSANCDENYNRLFVVYCGRFKANSKEFSTPRLGKRCSPSVQLLRFVYCSQQFKSYRQLEMSQSNKLKVANIVLIWAKVATSKREKK